jgi:formate dehydrogenase iron-sulfur subunit
MDPMSTVWVSADSAATSVGADEVAEALAVAGITVRRNGSRGMLWLEPLVEVETDDGRVGYANVAAVDIPALIAGGLDGGEVDGLDRIGVVAEYPWLARQHRVLRGRGGAGFPAGIKWETVRTATADVKFVCCNADEGDSGTFADRLLMEGDPFALIEGMTIAAHAVGATEGYIYLRSEYPHAIAVRCARTSPRARGAIWARTSSAAAT